MISLNALRELAFSEFRTSGIGGRTSEAVFHRSAWGAICLLGHHGLMEERAFTRNQSPQACRSEQEILCRRNAGKTGMACCSVLRRSVPALRASSPRLEYSRTNKVAVDISVAGRPHAWLKAGGLFCCISRGGRASANGFYRSSLCSVLSTMTRLSKIFINSESSAMVK